MKNLFLFIALLALVSCNSTKKQTNQQEGSTEVLYSYKLELVWESDTLLRTPESVLIDRDRNLLYVSNVNLNPWEKDGNGFISKIDKSGNIIDLKFIDGLNGPKGMGISDNSLFIADINSVIEANIETGEIINTIDLDGKPDLNDITVSDEGLVYVSGSGTNTIYLVTNGALEEVFKGEDNERFNGLFWEKERMLLLTSASSQFKEIDWNTKEVKIISENMGHGDAIAPVGDGGYITTSWKGAVFYVSPDGIPNKLLDTESVQENAADADFCIDEQILYVPTFYKNRVKAYKLVKSE